jgi:hypothetical protein
MSCLSFDEQLLDARLGLTEIFGLVRDTEHILHALLNPAHGVPLEQGCAGRSWPVRTSGRTPHYSFGRLASAATACRRQRFLSPKCDASRDRARNDIAHFPRWSDQQAKLAEDQMSFFEVGCSGRLGHKIIVAWNGGTEQTVAGIS